MELRYVQSEKESIMKCPNCGKEMRDGYLFCSKDGAFSFANEVPGVFENAKKCGWICEDYRVKAESQNAY